MISKQDSKPGHQSSQPFLLSVVGLGPLLGVSNSAILTVLKFLSSIEAKRTMTVVMVLLLFL